MDRFRILSLDGGGVKGTYTASVLANFEHLTGKPIVDHFDLITGTSAGGLIALGLGLGRPAEEILKFYVERGPQIFPSRGASRLVRSLRHVFRPKYSQEALQESIVDFFRDWKLGESRCRLVIPAFDCNAGRVHLFKTAHHVRFVQDYRRCAQEIAMATAAAPTYFPAFCSSEGQSFLDGGVWANCPVVIGLLEAVFVLGKAPSCIDVLSIGTTSSPFDVPTQRRVGGLLAWKSNVIDLLMKAQVDGAIAQAQIITGKRILRINATTRPGRFSLDDSTQIDALRGLGAQAAKDQCDEVASRFLDSAVAKFHPSHRLDEVHAQPRAKQYVSRRRRRRSLGTARAGFPHTVYQVVDISASGALLETPGEMPVGNSIELDLQLEDGNEARVAAKVVRNQQPRWGLIAGVGVQFTEFKGESQKIIERYVEHDVSDTIFRPSRTPIA